MYIRGSIFFSSFLRELSAGPLIFLGKNRRCLSRVTTRAFLERSPPVKSEPVPFLVRRREGETREGGLKREKGENGRWKKRIEEKKK